MSTRSLITVKCEDEKIRSIYVHFDGNRHLPILKKYYNSQELAENLIKLGDLSSLEKYLDTDLLGHTFEDPVKDVCVAYGRDRGEKNTKAVKFNSFKAAWKQDRWQEYVYEWDGKWTKWDVFKKREWND
jgi:hypothetical protein